MAVGEGRMGRGGEGDPRPPTPRRHSLPDLNPIVAIEGTSGVGKTTLAASLAARLGAVGFHFPPEFVRFRQAVRLDDGFPQIARLVYYAGGVLQLSEMVRTAAQDRSVVCDRYLASVLATVIADGEIEEREALRIIDPVMPYILVPDITVLLTCRHPTARRRLEDRAWHHTLTTVQRRTLESQEYFDRVQDAIRRHVKRIGVLVELDTEGSSPQALEAEALTSVRVALGLDLAPTTGQV